MNILYISQYYPPEMGAPSARVSELSKYWVKMGHNVTVITGMPNHPTGIIHPTYKWEYFKEEEHLGIRVLRVFLYVAPNKGVFKRIISFLSFMVTSLVVGLLMKTPDIIIATSPQLFVGLSGLLIAKLKRRPFIFEVRDIWPQSAVDLGIIRNRFVIRLMEMLEKELYQKSDAIVTAVSDMSVHISAKTNPSKIFYIPNAVDIERFESAPDIEFDWRRDNNDKFIIGYIGTIGLAHGLNIVIECAKKMRDKNVAFVLIGEGADKQHLKELLQAENISNVYIEDQISLDSVPSAFRQIDAGLVHLRDVPIMQGALPSKIFEIMAAGIPVLAGIKGHGRKFINEHKVGLCFEPEDPDDMKLRIEELLRKPDTCKEYGNNGLKIIKAEYNREAQAEKYLKIIKNYI